MGETKIKNLVMMRDLFLTSHCSVMFCFELLEVGFGLYLKNKIIKSEKLINLLFFD